MHRFASNPRHSKAADAQNAERDRLLKLEVLHLSGSKVDRLDVEALAGRIATLLAHDARVENIEELKDHGLFEATIITTIFDAIPAAYSVVPVEGGRSTTRYEDVAGNFTDDGMTEIYREVHRLLRPKTDTHMWAALGEVAPAAALVMDKRRDEGAVAKGYLACYGITSNKMLMEQQQLPTQARKRAAEAGDYERDIAMLTRFPEMAPKIIALREVTAMRETQRASVLSEQFGSRGLARQVATERKRLTKLEEDEAETRANRVKLALETAESVEEDTETA